MKVIIKELPYKHREDTYSMTCYIAPIYVTQAFSKAWFGRTLHGTITIDGEVVKWWYNTSGNDGCMFPEDTPYRFLVESLIPVFLYGKHIEETIFF